MEIAHGRPSAKDDESESKGHIIQEQLIVLEEKRNALVNTVKALEQHLVMLKIEAAQLRGEVDKHQSGNIAVPEMTIHY